MKVLVSLLVSCTGALLLCTPPAFSQGSLAPPGPPAPMMRTLEQVEPRIPITNLPWTITAPGSYYFTTNLVTAVLTNGVTVLADHVTIDLRGFALVGTGPFGGNYNAINVPGSWVNLKVLNGSIANWSGEGVSASTVKNGQLENLRVVNIGRSALHVGNGWTVIACVVYSNGFYQFGSPGIQAGDYCTIKDSAAHNINGPGIGTGKGCVVVGCAASTNADGIVTGDACRISDCVASYNPGINGGNGIRTGCGCTINGCAARDNGHDGITVLVGCSIIGCAVSSNHNDGIIIQYGSTVKDCTALKNVRDGIGVNEKCYIAGNTCDMNGRAGIYCYNEGNHSRVDSNSTTDNGLGSALLDAGGVVCFVAANNVFVVRNSSHGNIVDYNLAAGTRNAAIYGFPPQGFAINDPWGNFQY